jgi:type II secretory pathway pseudopilin PulG
MPDVTSLFLGTALPIIAITIIGIVVAMIFVRRLTGNTAANRQLLATGETAQATILQMSDTGMRINDNPRVSLLLEVHPANRPAYQVEIKQVISMLQASQYQPGQQLEVKIDPADPKKVVISAILAGAGVGEMMGGMPSAANAQQVEQMLLAQEQMYNAVRSMGEAAQATIMSATDMNIRVNDQASMMRLHLLVQPTNKPPFQAETQGAISDIARAKYQTGGTIWVKFNPNDQTQVSLDHS